MEELPSTILVLKPDEVPMGLRELLAGLQQPAALASLELLPNGEMVVQVASDVDPRVVARARRIMAQYDDVLRRLS